MTYGDLELCDRCFDRRLSGRTGFPRLPDLPAHETVTGPDGRRHRIEYRLWRAPTGVVAEAAELDCPAGEGYHVEVMGSHDADAEVLLDRVRTRLRQRIGQLDLVDGPGGYPVMARDEVVGRLVWNQDDAPYDVVVDGRRMSWDAFGRALEPFEGWHFRLQFDDAELEGDGGALNTETKPATRRRTH